MKAHDNIEGARNKDVLWPSDNLGILREFVSCLPQFGAIIGELPQFRVVIDANIALAELIFRLKNKRNSNARSSLHEVIAAGTVIAYAPLSLCKEVETKIPKIAGRQNLPRYRLREEWQKFQALLHFYEPEVHVDRLGTEAVDPKDLPYRNLWAEIGARGVYSKDPHLPRMGAPLITIDVVLALRDYSRAASIEVGIKVGGVVIVAAGIELLRGMMVLLSAAGRGLSRLPAAAKVVLAMVAIIAIAHPTSRKMIKTRLQSVFKELGEIALPLLTSVSKNLSVAERDKAIGWEAASKKLPIGKKYPARTHLRALCTATTKPLSLFELERRLLSVGYVTRAKNPRAYLKRILQNDPRFVQIQPGYWVISRSQVATMSCRRIDD